VHDSRGIDIVNFTISLALSAGTLMASAGRPTPYRLVPAHFYPCSTVTYIMYMYVTVKGLYNVLLQIIENSSKNVIRMLHIRGIKLQ